MRRPRRKSEVKVQEEDEGQSKLVEKVEGRARTIIAIGISDQEGYPIPFTTFLKMGVGLTVVHFVISMIYLYIKYGILSM